MEMAAGNGQAELKRKQRNRLMLAAFGACAVVFFVLPNALIWWGSRGLCPTTVTSHGTFDGTAWEVLRSDCGDAKSEIWQMRVIPDRGYSTVVMESRGDGPRPVGWEQSGFEGTVILSKPPAGETSMRIPVKLDPKGQPLGEVDFQNGVRHDLAARN